MKKQNLQSSVQKIIDIQKLLNIKSDYSIDLYPLVKLGILAANEQLFFVANKSKSCKVPSQKQLDELTFNFVTLADGSSRNLYDFIEECSGHRIPEDLSPQMGTHLLCNKDGRTLYELWTIMLAKESSK